MSAVYHSERSESVLENGLYTFDRVDQSNLKYFGFTVCQNNATKQFVELFFFLFNLSFLLFIYEGEINNRRIVIKDENM